MAIDRQRRTSDGNVLLRENCGQQGSDDYSYEQKWKTRTQQSRYWNDFLFVIGVNQRSDRCRFNSLAAVSR